MTEAQATILAATLAAAFPRDWAFVGEATNAVYVEKIAKLDRFEAARDAIDELIESELRLPPIALIRETYKQAWGRYSPPALPEPEITEEEREKNLRRMVHLTSHLAARGEHGHTRDFASCAHPGCAELRSLSVPDAGQD